MAPYRDTDLAARYDRAKEMAEQIDGYVPLSEEISRDGLLKLIGRDHPDAKDEELSDLLVKKRKQIQEQAYSIEDTLTSIGYKKCTKDGTTLFARKDGDVTQVLYTFPPMIISEKRIPHIWFTHTKAEYEVQDGDISIVHEDRERWEASKKWFGLGSLSSAPWVGYEAINILGGYGTTPILDWTILVIAAGLFAINSVGFRYSRSKQKDYWKQRGELTVSYGPGKQAFLAAIEPTAEHKRIMDGTNVRVDVEEVEEEKMYVEKDEAYHGL